MRHSKYIPFPILMPLVIDKEEHKTPLEKALSATFEYMQETVIKKIAGKLPDEITSNIELWSIELNPLRYAFNLLLFQLNETSVDFDKEEAFRELENDAKIQAVLEKEEIEKIVNLFEIYFQNFERFVSLKDDIEIFGQRFLLTKSLDNLVKIASYLEFTIISLISLLSGKVSVEQSSFIKIIDLSYTFLEYYSKELESISFEMDKWKNPAIFSLNIQPNTPNLDRIFSDINQPIPEIKDSTSRSKDWIREFSQPYKDKWVAVLDGQLLGFDTQINNLYQKLDSSIKNNKNLIITKVISE